MSQRKPPRRPQPRKPRHWPEASAWIVLAFCLAVWLLTIMEAWR